MNIKKLFLALLLLVSTGLVAQQTHTKYILKNAFVFTGEMKDDFAKSDIYVANGKIVKVLPQSAITIDSFKNAKVYDLTGKYITPGLIDSHVHLTNGVKNNSYEGFQKEIYPVLKQELYGGVTTVRDLAGDGLVLAMAVRSSKSGLMPSPDIFFSALMAGKKYYNELNMRDKDFSGYVPEEDRPWYQTIYDTTNVVEAITRAKASGATGIKLYNSMGKEIIEKLAKEAKRQHMQVWGHATLVPALPMDFINAGVKVVSHIDLLSYQQLAGTDTENVTFDYETHMSLKKDFPGLQEMLKVMKDKDVIVDATYFLIAMNYTDKELFLSMLKKLKQAGIKVSVGTDWMYDNEKKEANVHREMREMIEAAGYTPKEMIHSATVIGAETIGVTDRGVIADGKKADMLILNANPFNDIANLKKIKTVIKTGIMYEVNQVKKKK